MVKKRDDNNLYPHLKSTHNLKVMKKTCSKNSKYVSKSQNFKSPLPHGDGV
jgi:hypothetical protein